MNYCICISVLVGETTLFFFIEFPAFFPDEPSVVFFQSVLNPNNFLGVRRNAAGELELASDVSKPNNDFNLLYCAFADGWF